MSGYAKVTTNYFPILELIIPRNLEHLCDLPKLTESLNKLKMILANHKSKDVMLVFAEPSITLIPFKLYPECHEEQYMLIALDENNPEYFFSSNRKFIWINDIPELIKFGFVNFKVDKLYNIKCKILSV